MAVRIYCALMLSLALLGAYSTPASAGHERGDLFDTFTLEPEHDNWYSTGWYSTGYSRDGYHRHAHWADSHAGWEGASCRWGGSDGMYDKNGRRMYDKRDSGKEWRDTDVKRGAGKGQAYDQDGRTMKDDSQRTAKRTSAMDRAGGDAKYEKYEYSRQYLGSKYVEDEHAADRDSSGGFYGKCGR